MSAKCFMLTNHCSDSLGSMGTLVRSDRPIMLLAEHLVVLVVGRGNLEATCSELDVDIAVLDDGDDTAHQRHDDLVALKPGILGVFGIDAHGRIAHDCLWTGGGDHSITASLGIGMYHLTLCSGSLDGIVVCQIVAQVIELGLLGLIEHLVIRDGGEVLGIPVDHTEAAIDKPLVVEVAEHLGHCLRTLLVHGERSALPVA